jgi:hypothetical protein
MAAVVAEVGTGTNVTQSLVAPYERLMIGGDLKLKVGSAAGTNATVTAKIFYQPLPK